MELFSLVLINMLFCGMMYVFISAKVQKSVGEYYDKKLNRAIDMATSETIRELDATVNVIESRLVALRQMIEKAENIASEFRHYEKFGLSMKEELVSSKQIQKQELVTNSKPEVNTEPAPKMELKEQRTGIGLIYQQNQIVSPLDEVETTEGAVNIAFGKLGKAVKGMFGMESDSTPSNAALDSLDVPTFKPKTDFTVGGNPFSEEKSNQAATNLIDTVKRSEFMNTVSKKNDPAFDAYQKNRLDKVQISIESALEDLPATASKIDKVVHLIKKGYKHEEISEAMNIGTHEIHLIETIRLDRSRRI